VVAASSTSTTTTPSEPGDADRSCDPADYDPAELEATMPTEIAGFERQPDDYGDTGPSDLAKAVRDDGLADAEELLADARFLRGYQRLFQAADSAQVIVFVYEFCDETGSEAYARRFDEEGAIDGQTFEVPGIPGAIGAADVGEERQGAAVQFTRGGFVVMVTAGAPLGSEVDLDAARALAVATATDVHGRLAPFDQPT
jgi:hypothetical protein